MRTLMFLLATALLAQGEQKTVTLNQAVALALQQNPDLLMARLDEQKAVLEVQAVKEPLLPRVIVGSGLAYSSGMPMSIEGSAPAVVQAKAVRSLWNPQQNYQVAQARESARAATFGTAAVREDVALRVASLYLDLEKAGKSLATASRQVEHLLRVEAAVRLRVEEGRELPIEAKRAAVNVARARSRVRAWESSRSSLGRSLALVLGLPGGDEVLPAGEQRPQPALAAGHQQLLEEALKDNQEIRKLEAEMAAKGLEAHSFRAARLPKIDLVAQYGLLAKFNNYEDYFNRFQRNNVQIGASIQVPLFANSSDEARAAQAEIEARRLRALIGQVRGRIEAGIRQDSDRIADAEAAREVARLDLEVARDQASILLAQMEEGRTSLRVLEEARYQEEDRWQRLSDADYQLELARFELLRRTNSLVASLK